MKFLIIFAAVVGYTLNLLAIFYGVYDAFADNLTITECMKLAGVTALRIAGVFFTLWVLFWATYDNSLRKHIASLVCNVQNHHQLVARFVLCTCSWNFSLFGQIMIYKSQLKKAFSRGLRGKANNVPGFMGRIFHRIGKDAAKGVELDYLKVIDCSEFSEAAISLHKWTGFCGPCEAIVLHNNKFYVFDLKVFFYAADALETYVK